MEPENFSITHPSGAWSVQHDRSRAGVFSGLQVSGQELLRTFSCSYDDFSDDLLLADKLRLSRKSGCAVLHRRGHFPFGAGHGLTQTYRYAGNSCRVSSDWRWRANSELHTSLELGSAVLPGRWQRLLLIPAGLTANDKFSCAWQTLQPGQSLQWDELPLIVLLENDAGLRLELGLGNDLWRWQGGMGTGAGLGGASLEIGPQQACFRRQIIRPGSAVELIPDGRDYRFCSYFAWSAPELLPSISDATAVVDLFFDAKGKLCRQSLPSDLSDSCLRFDCRRLPFPGTALRRYDGIRQSEPCWESNITQKFFRQLVRQLAEYSSHGSLWIDGMTPGLCQDGVHCKRKQDACHWDMVSILDAAIWMRQRLGKAWQVKVVQEPDSPWNELPSLACLGAVNGFRVEKQPDETREDDDGEND